MTELSFTKMQGLGNDFVVLDGPVDLEPGEVVGLCDRRRGIGADGVLVVTPGDPIRMEYWNSDGSFAEMCGNGLRCVARYAHDRGWAADTEFGVATPIGIREVRILEDGIEAELGSPSTTGEARLDGTAYHLVDVGNPHAVAIVDDPSAVDVPVVGRAVETHPRFENGTNVEFISVDDRGVTMRVWERGVGETPACGTGIVAAAYVASVAKGLGDVIGVRVPGGEAVVELRDGVAWLRGPAEYSFRGSVGGH